jgi:uncharacterized membrane protein
MYRAALAMAILGTVMYHVAQKLTPRTANPFLSLAVTYLVALGACLVVLATYGRNGITRPALQQLNWTSIACGLSIFLVEVGVLLAYRANWNLKTLSLVANTSVALLLVPLGVWFFRESLTFRNVIGIALCLCGLLILQL